MVCRIFACAHVHKLGPPMKQAMHHCRCQCCFMRISPTYMAETVQVLYVENTTATHNIATSVFELSGWLLRTPPAPLASFLQDSLQYSVCVPVQSTNHPASQPRTRTPQLAATSLSPGWSNQLHCQTYLPCPAWQQQTYVTCCCSL